MEQFIKVLKTYGRVSAALAEDLLENGVRQEVKKGDLIQTIGHPIDQLVFVEKGLLMYFQFRETRKYIVSFKQENKYALLLLEVEMVEEMSKMGVEALEDGIIWSFSSEFLGVMYRKHLEFNRHVMIMAQNDLKQLNEETRLLREKSGVEWHLYLKATAPSLLSRVPIEDLASYMNISVTELEHVMKKMDVRLNMLGKKRTEERVEGRRRK